MVNQIFGFLSKDYDTVFGMPIKQGTITIGLLFLSVGFVLAFGINVFTIASFIPGIFLLLVYKAGLDSVLYSLFNSFFPKDDAVFNTQYLTNRLLTVNDTIAYTYDDKTCIIKFYTNSYFDKPEDIKMQVKTAFNAIIINYSTLVPKLVFRSLNKKLDMSSYFNEVSKILPSLKSSTVAEKYFETYSKEYIDISQDITDHDYYIELKFPIDTKDETIKNIANEFIGSLVSYGFNIDATHYPTLLRGDEIYTYYRELIAGITEENKYILPIVTE